MPVAIKSVQDQESANWELLIVDDGSTDCTKELVQNYKDSRIIYLYQEHQGVAAARNYGAEKAQGNYLVFLDSDDKFLPGLFSQLNKFLNQEFDIICWEVLKKIDEREIHWKPQVLSGLYNGIKATFLAGSILYSKKTFWKVGGYDPHLSFGENYELGLRLSRLDHLKIKIIEKPFLRYIVDTKGRTSNSLENRLTSYLYQYETHLSLYEKYPKDHSQINYFIGFVQEKLDMKKAALRHYKKARKYNPSNMKPYLKILYLYLFK